MTHTYRTNEIAKLGNVHPNTVRIYEEWGYISPVPREKNGYRVYTPLHLFQLRVARLAFRCELIQNDLRKRATSIVQYCGQKNFSEALMSAKDYLVHLQLEHSFSLEAIDIVQKWKERNNSECARSYTHEEASIMLGITQDTLRNWERNGLFTVERNSKRHRVYKKTDIERLIVIRSLRSAHFSMSSILRLVRHDSKKPMDIKTILNTPSVTDDIIYVTDQLELNLRKAITDVKILIQLLEEYNNKEVF